VPSKISNFDGGDALVVTHKEFESEFRGLLNVATRHHGYVASEDDFGHFRRVFVIGAPWPKVLPPATLERPSGMPATAAPPQSQRRGRVARPPA
jgi:hypothetical protein